MNLIQKIFFLPFFMQMNIIYSSKKKNQGRELCPCMHAKLLQSCPTPCDPMDYTLPSSFVCEILQARILEGLPFPSPGNLSDPGIEPASPVSPVLACGFITTERPGRPLPISVFFRNSESSLS